MSLALFLAISILALCSITAQDIYGEYKEEQASRELNIFKNLDELISFFRNETNPLAHEVLDTFLTKCQFPDYTRRLQGHPRKPVIVIEGNHKSSRDVVVMGLSQLMNARYVNHPAPCIHKYHKLLPKGSNLRRAYYLLSNYAGSRYAKSQLNRPIVINGYWSEQLAFTLTHVYPPGELPPIHSDIFAFPDDLLKPDIIFYLDFPNKMIYHHVTTKSPLTWKPRMLEVYSHMQARYPIVLKEMKPLFKLTTEEIHRHIHQHLYDKVFGVRNTTGTVH